MVLCVKSHGTVVKFQCGNSDRTDDNGSLWCEKTLTMRSATLEITENLRTRRVLGRAHPDGDKEMSNTMI